MAGRRTRLESMDHKTSLIQHINAPAEKVWAVISDPTRLSRAMMAIAGPLGMRFTRKALAEIAAKAESL